MDSERTNNSYAAMGVHKVARECLIGQICCTLALFVTWVCEVTQMTALTHTGPMTQNHAEWPGANTPYTKAVGVVSTM